MLRNVEKRWGLAVQIDDRWHVLGKHCWLNADKDEPIVRTFRTQKLARAAKSRLTSYRARTRVVPITVTVEER